MKKEIKWIIIALIIAVLLALIVFGGTAYYLFKPPGKFDTGGMRGEIIEAQVN